MASPRHVGVRLLGERDEAVRHLRFDPGPTLRDVLAASSVINEPGPGRLQGGRTRVEGSTLVSQPPSVGVHAPISLGTVHAWPVG